MPQDLEYTIPGESLSRGLRPNTQVLRDSGYLADCDGLVGRDQILVSLDALTKTTTDIALLIFPYPQIFILPSVTLVCTGTDIYEWRLGVLTHKFSVSAPGHRWHLVAYGEFIYLSNSRVSLVRDINGDFDYTTLPLASAICDNNGQIVISGEMETVVYLTSRPYPVEVFESVNVLAAYITEGTFSKVYHEFSIAEDVNVLDAYFTGGDLRSVQYAYTYWPMESISILDAPVTGGALIQLLMAYTYWPPESANILGTLITGGELRDLLIEYTFWPAESANILDVYITGGVHETP